jgi:hypothetical protein
MIIAGEWFVCDDGVTRPVARAKILQANGAFLSERFLVDSAADRTVLSAAVLKKAVLPISLAPPGVTLQGIGGESSYVVVKSILAFACEDGRTARVHGDFAAFTEGSATDISIMGRDVLDQFDVITSRRRDAVLLLAGHHQYEIMSN